MFCVGVRASECGCACDVGWKCKCVWMSVGMCVCVWERGREGEDYCVQAWVGTSRALPISIPGPENLPPCNLFPPRARNFPKLSCQKHAPRLYCWFWSRALWTLIVFLWLLILSFANLPFQVFHLPRWLRVKGIRVCCFRLFCLVFTSCLLNVCVDGNEFRGYKEFQINSN